MTDACKYVIDTDVLVHIDRRSDRDALYEGIIALASSGLVRTVRQVFDELRRHENPHLLLSPHRNSFVLSASLQYCEPIGEVMDRLGEGAAYLWEQTGGTNPDPADPWLVAVAHHHRYTLVTDENQRKATRIPAACRFINARCITGPHFLHEVGIVTEFRPEHIDPDAFYK